jgi:hypothetical protein
MEQIQQYLTGAWRLMWGKADGLRLLDLSVDGFWNSFFAIAVAAPVLIVGWVSAINEYEIYHSEIGGRLSILLRLAIIDLGTWVIPIALFVAIAPRVGLADRLVHYVVSSNWAAAVTAWLMLPPSLLRLFLPSQPDATALVTSLAFIFCLVLTWRQTNASLGKGPVIGSAVFAGTLVGSIVLLVWLQSALGLVIPDQLPTR